MQLLFTLQLSYIALVMAALLTSIVFVILDRRNKRPLALAYAVGDVVRCTRNGQHHTGAITELLAPGPAGRPRFAVIAVQDARQPRAVMVRYRKISALLRERRG